MLEKLVSVIASPIPFLILISVVITVHELGHYWAGRTFGAAVESFSVGFGSPIFEVRDRRGTRWRVNWLPLGGFVKFTGEMQAPGDSRNEAAAPGLIGRPYTDLTPLQRMIVSLGGPLANFLFAIVVFAAFAMTFGVMKADEVRVASVAAESPAESAGFRIGDVVIEAGGQSVSVMGDVIRATALSAGEDVVYRVRRDGEEIVLTARPQEVVERNEAFGMVEKVGRVGLGLEHVNLHMERANPIEAVSFGAQSTFDVIASTVNVLRRLVSGLDGLDKMSGPVGILNLSDNVTDIHMKQEDVPLADRLAEVTLRLIELAALFSIGVGFFNLLPVPMLDGWAVVLCAAEAATGKDVPEVVHRIGLTIGLACLVSFTLLVTWNDLTRPGGPLEVLSGMLS